jgi:hypothetical protein
MGWVFAWQGYITYRLLCAKTFIAYITRHRNLQVFLAADVFWTGLAIKEVLASYLRLPFPSSFPTFSLHKFQGMGNGLYIRTHVRTYIHTHILLLLLLLPLALQPFVGFGFLNQIIRSLTIQRQLFPIFHIHRLHIVTHILGIHVRIHT